MVAAAAATSVSAAAPGVRGDCGALVVLHVLRLAAASGQFVVAVVVKVANETTGTRFSADLAAARAAVATAHLNAMYGSVDALVLPTLRQVLDLVDRTAMAAAALLEVCARVPTRRRRLRKRRGC